MKKQLLYLVVGCVSALLASCNEEEQTDALIVSPEQVVIPVKGSEQTITVNASGTWQVVEPSDAPWFFVTPNSGTGTQTLYLSAAPNNESTQERTTILSISMGGLLKDIFITQPGSSIPMEAGVISGFDYNTCPARTVTLTTSVVEGADSYKWYKNGAEITNATDDSYVVAETGSYTVAAVNIAGTGPLSAPKQVTIDALSCPLHIDDLVGEWTVTEEQCPQALTIFTATSYTIVIEKTGETTIKVKDLAGSTVASLGKPANVNATITKPAASPDTLLMSIPAQYVTDWSLGGTSKTRFVAVNQGGTHAALRQSFNEGFTGLSIVKDAEGNISMEMNAATAPYSYAMLVIKEGDAVDPNYPFYILVKNTKWVKK